MLLAWTRGFFCPLLVIFSVAQFSLEVSHEPRLRSAQTYEHLIYTLHTETHTPAPAESLFTLFPHPGTVLYILSVC